MSRTYIAGGMTGYPAYGFALFDLARDALTVAGWQVVSPADLDRANGFDPIKNPDQKPLDYEFCMKRDQAAMRTCQAAHFLPGWQASKGANREMAHALELGLDLYRCWWTGAEFHEEPILAFVSIGGSDAHLPDEGYDGGDDPPDSLDATTDVAPEDSSTSQQGGLRLDDGKPRIELVPPSTMIAIAEVLGASAQPRGKYPERNWEKGMAWSKSYAPAMRHLLAWWGGEDIDPESGLHHLWHAETDLAFLVEWLRTGIGADDRPHREGKE